MDTDLSLASPAQSRAARGRWLTVAALGFGHFVDQGEGQAMSTLFPAIRDALGLSYSHLGVIATIRLILQTLSQPVWGYLADRFNRKWVIVFGTGIWGLWTVACGLVTNYWQLLWVRAIAGIGLGCLMPPTFSLISDLFGPRERGRAMGVLGGVGYLGIVLSVLGLGFLLRDPVMGWRYGFISLGLASVLSGVVIALVVKEPPRGAAEPELQDAITYEAAGRFVIRREHLGLIFRIPTMWVIFVQGVFGVIPWVIMGTYFITWLVDVRGIPQTQAPMVFAAIVVGQVVANVVGGVVADWADRRSPAYGRIVVAQFSMFNGIWMTYVLFTRTGGLTFVQLTAFAFVVACFIGWAGKGSRDPILQGVLLPELRSTAWAIAGAVEGSLSALSAFWAGWLADRLGLQATLLAVPGSWVLLWLAWLSFYWVYPRDSLRLRAAMAARRKELEGARAEAE
jgi:MFS family permease